MKPRFKILLVTLLVIFIVLGFALPVNPPGPFWYQQFMPNIGNKQITDITFLDSLNGYAVASQTSDSSYFLRTTNNGDNWQIIYRQGPAMTRIRFLNLFTGYAGGSYLFKTTNQGLNWSTIVTPGTTQDISVQNSDTIWYVDPNGLTGGVFRTTDSGTSWQQQLNLGSQNPSKIYMYNARIGFVSSTAGLYKTTNGSNWSNVSNDFSFSDMFLIDSLTGWKASGFIKKTTDGGFTWINQPVPQGGNILGNGAIRFMNKAIDTIWAVGESIIVSGSPPTRGILFRTINGGANWLFQLPDTSIHINRYLFGWFLNNRIGWAYSFAPTGIHTTNGGDTTFLAGIRKINTQVPEHFKLYQNYPNPFNPVTIIRYNVKRQTQNVKLIVYDITGNEIITLVNQKQNAGTYTVDFSGNNLCSGVYLYKIIISDGKEEYTDTKKMILLK